MSFLPSCREVSESFARGDYREQPLLRRLRVRAHLWHCDLCSKYQAQLGLLKQALRRIVAPEQAVEVLKSRLKAGL